MNCSILKRNTLLEQKKEKNIDDERFKSAIKTTSFDVLKKKEETEGFPEAAYSSKEKKIK